MSTVMAVSIDAQDELNRKFGSRRLVAVPVYHEFLVQFFTLGCRFDNRIWVEQGLPVGARLVNSFYDHWRRPGCVILVFEHESFDVVPDGEMIPEMLIVYRRDGSKIKI